MQTVSFDVQGYLEKPVPNRRLSRDEARSTHLAIFLPGMGYNVDMPLLFYPRIYLMQQGADVLLVEYNYLQQDEYLKRSSDEQRTWLHTDVLAVCDAALEAHDYERLTIVGKSLGTYAMAHLLSDDRFQSASCVWLTPLIYDQAVFAAMKRPHRALFVIGTRDMQYDADKMQEAARSSGAMSLVVERANHGMFVENDIIGTVRVMENIMQSVQELLKE